jgi:ribosomal protein L37E
MSRTPPADIPCPRCGAPVGSEQAWCLTCGAPARTRMRPTPNWKLPLLAIAVIVLIVAGGTVGAFVALTTDNEAPKASTVSTATVPAATPPPAATGTPTDPNAVPSPDPNADPAAPPAATTATTTAPAPPATTSATTGPTPPPVTTTAPD